jgi:hypothetical protein
LAGLTDRVGDTRRLRTAIVVELPCATALKIARVTLAAVSGAGGASVDDVDMDLAACGKLKGACVRDGRNQTQ